VQGALQDLGLRFGFFAMTRPLLLAASAAAVATAAAAASSSASAAATSSSAAATYTNPVLSRDCPDPTVLRGGDGAFYVYCTMGGGVHIQVASSPDLVTWAYHGEALEPPAWMGSASWAPDVTLHNGTYFMYLGATQASSGVMCIAVATSASPLGPFRDARGTPLFCSPPAPESFAAIDPKSFDDEATGRTYLYFGSDGAPISAVELASSRTALAPGSPPPFPPLNPLITADPAQPYEGTLVEGAWLHKTRGLYYLFYSGNNCCSSGAHYAVMVARASDAQGPFVKIGNATGSGSNVILSEGAGGFFAAPGHNSVITDDAGNDFMFYHAYKRGDLAGPRMLLMDRITYDAAGWPHVGEPSSTPQPAPMVAAARGGRGKR
jgi:arabinan endo-1,5-alpha-L-arabinosidase